MPEPIGESAHDHGNCELCDALDRDRDALRSTVADLTASLKVAQESLGQREAAQRAAEETRDQQIQAAYVAQEAQLAQGWKVHETEAKMLRLADYLSHWQQCALVDGYGDNCTCGLDAAREG